MAEPEVEAAWRAEFKQVGEAQFRESLQIEDSLRRRDFVGGGMKGRLDGSETRKLPLCSLDFRRCCSGCNC